jgi:predicted RNase H-like HicB family nuclease
VNWRVILQPDEETGDWAVWCPQLPGCASAGRTREEALTTIREAIALYLEVDDDAVPPGAEVHQVDAA